jgi:hypothetical protein
MNFWCSGEGTFTDPERVLRDSAVVHYGDARPAQRPGAIV